MPNWLLNVRVIDGPLPYIVWGLTLAGGFALLLRRPTSRWLLRVAIGMVAGAVLGVGLVLVVNASKTLASPLPTAVAFWVGAAFALLGLAVVSLWESSAWRKIISIAVVVLTVSSATLGINAVFGIDRSIADMLGVSGQPSIDDLGGPLPRPSPTGPTYANWKAPADMPKQGKVGLLTGANAIPSTAGFKPRDASIYLPPAAQVKDPPPLPLVVFMMGFPGNPNPEFIAAALDEMASKNNGLAPIAIIADQLGDPSQDPGCTDSKQFGGVSTYFNRDIPAFAKSKLNIMDDPRYWIMSGYSNGGGCAIKWAAEFPEVWGNLVDVSGDQYPGIENSSVLADVFAGDSAAFAAASPATLLAKNKGKFSGHVAVLTVGQNDPQVSEWAKKNAALLQDAGFAVTDYVVPGADHQEQSIRGGLPEAFGVLYPRLGLAPPPK